MKIKNILSVILAAFMVFGCSIATVHAADATIIEIGGDKTSYTDSEIKSALTSAKNGVVKLKSNITVTTTGSTGITVPTEVAEYTIDLNGFTLSSSATRFMDTQGSASLRKLTIKNGAIEHTGTTVFVFIRHGIDVIFDNVKITTAGNTTYSAFCFRASGSSDSSLSILNSVVTTTSKSGGSTAIFSNTATTNKVSLTVDGSVLNPMVGTFADKKINTVSVTNTTVNIQPSVASANKWVNFPIGDDSIVSDSASGDFIDGIVSDGYLVTSIANNYSTLYIYDSTPEAEYFAITVDGIFKRVEKGYVYTVPYPDEKYCFTDAEGNLYYGGEKITINSDLTLTTIPIPTDERMVDISIHEGASIRLSPINSEQQNGLRFYTDIDIDKVNALIGEGYTVELGTLIAPTDIADSYDKMVLENADNLLDVKYDAKYLGTYYSNGFVGSIINIVESNTSFSEKYGNIARKFIARSYCKVSKDGDSYVSYATYNSSNARSLAYVSQRLKEDTSKYEALSEQIKEHVNAWAKALDELQLGELTYIDFEIPNLQSHFSGSTFTEKACLLLPATYSKEGEATRLIIDCHGFSETAAQLKTNCTWMEFFAHQGYAVVMVDGGGSYNGAYNMGNRDAVNGNIAAYEYVIKNYNIKKDGVFVKGSSMGGTTSQNLVCSGKVPVLGHINESAITSYFRQLYCNPWDKDNISRVARYFNFDFTGFEDENGTEYTLSTFPFSKQTYALSDDERNLFVNNFSSKVAPVNYIWKYCSSFFDYDAMSFKSGYEDFLTATDETRIAELYDSISVDYPVPILICHGTGDRSVPYVWSQRFVNAVNRSENGNATLVTYDTNKHCRLGDKVNVECKDGETFTTYDSFVKMYDFMQSLEK